MEPQSVQLDGVRRSYRKLDCIRKNATLGITFIIVIREALESVGVVATYEELTNADVHRRVDRVKTQEEFEALILSLKMELACSH